MVMDKSKGEIVSSRAWGSRMPWPFILLFLITLLFFCGGILLDALAGQTNTEGVRRLFPISDKTIDSKTGAETVVTHEYDIKSEDRATLIQFEKEKADRLASSAHTLYDMAKIALGALLTCLTQMINFVVQRTTPDDDPSAPPDSVDNKV